MTRILDDDFELALMEGSLAPLLKAVSGDRDLLLEIRKNCFNVYFKGQSLLRLEKKAQDIYEPHTHKEFLVGLQELQNTSPFVADDFVRDIPKIKENILRRCPSGTEIEYDQMIVRANNCESRLKTEYYIIDRQVAAADPAGQFDLLGFVWPRENRGKNCVVPLALLEVKYGPNADIKDLHDQLSRYHEALNRDFESLAENAQLLFRQKLRLGLICGTPEQREALKDIRISRNPDDVRFGIVLVDYNPASRALDLKRLSELPFSKQIDIFHVGFGLWQANARDWAQDLTPTL
jgi:hypothetical protein